jgi:hypothetical protein
MSAPRAASVLAALALASACTAEVTTAVDDDAVETAVPDLAKGDAPGWSTQAALHLDDPRFGAVDAGDRHVYPLWVAGAADAPIPLDVTVRGQDGAAVRVAVLGPLVGGTRAVLGSAGYVRRTSKARVAVSVDRPGQILVVVGAFRLADFVGYEVGVRCRGGACGPDAVDALAAPKSGAMIGEAQEDGSILIRTQLNAALAGQDMFEVELWRSPPGLRWAAELVATSTSSGTQANFLLPADALAEGDDLSFVIRGGELATADGGTWARYTPTPRLYARLDAILYGDLGSMQIAGVTGYFEGNDLLSLRRAHDGEEIIATVVEADLPGQEGIGFGTFDATFAPELILEDGEVNPLLPRNGEILALGRIGGDGNFRPLGCFEFCNDLKGTGECTPRPSACP